MKGLLPAIILPCILLFSCGSGNGDKNSSPSAKVDTQQAIDSQAVSLPYPSVDISPMDMSYYPVDYPKLKMTKSIDSPPRARVIYSRPHLQGRRLFPDILKYGETWRLGANEATELQLFDNTMIQGQKIEAGRYILYCIPREDKWTIILNSNIDTWGLQQDPSKDVARFEIPVTQNSWNLEYFSMTFQKTTEGAELLIAWEKFEARLPFIF